LPTKIVVLGAGGMLGHKMFQRLRAAFPGTTGIIRAQTDAPPFHRIGLFHGGGVLTGIDALDFEKLASTLLEIRPDFIVNCIGIIKQRPWPRPGTGG